MTIEFNCSVDEIEDSYIPNVKVLGMRCDKAMVKMDIHRDLNPVEKGERINFGIYKSIPPHVKGRDFVAQGYVVSKRQIDTGVKVYISLWGYLVIITTSDNEINRSLNPMDKVYVKLWK